MLGLFLFGGEVLRGFGFTMVVGILVGTYSTHLHREPDRGLVVEPRKATPAGGTAVRAAAIYGGASTRFFHPRGEEPRRGRTRPSLSGTDERM